MKEIIGKNKCNNKIYLNEFFVNIGSSLANKIPQCDLKPLS